MDHAELQSLTMRIRLLILFARLGVADGCFDGTAKG